MTTLAVVGGGVTGLAAAWYAAAAGLDVTVFEAAPRVGGKLQVVEVGGVPVDVGAESMLATRPEGVGLLDELGLTGHRLAPLTTAALVRAGGRAHPLPARTMLGIPGDVEALRASGVVSDEAVRAVGAEPSQAPLRPMDRDVPVGALVRSRLGDEVADRLVEPLLGGVYAGRADELSLRSTMPKLAELLAHGGSLVEAVRAVTGSGGTRAPATGSPFTSVRGGLGSLPDALAGTGRFAVRTATTVRSLARAGAGFTLECGAVPVAEHVAADAVIVAAPAAKAARLLAGLAPAAAGELAGIDSASIAIVTFAFPAEAAAALPAGSGLLVGARERLATKAVTLTSQKWPVGDGSVLLRASAGRHGEPQALQFTDADLVTLVRRELQVLFGLDLEPLDALVTRWGGGLPQYAVGHAERVTRIRAAVAAVPGLAVCGAAYDGVGIPACVGSARIAVDRVLGHLGGSGQ